METLALKFPREFGGSSSDAMFVPLPVPPRANLTFSSSYGASVTTPYDSTGISNGVGSPQGPTSSSTMADSTPVTTVSMLSYILEAKASAGGGQANGGGGKKIKLTIYLPDLSPLEIQVSETENFEGVILSVLKQHQEECRKPELYYHCPEMYELRMHEGITFSLY